MTKLLKQTTSQKNLTHVLTRVDVNCTMVKNAFGTTTEETATLRVLQPYKLSSCATQKNKARFVCTLQTQSDELSSDQKEGVCVRSWSKLIQGSFTIKGKDVARERDAVHFR